MQASHISNRHGRTQWVQDLMGWILSCPILLKFLGLSLVISGLLGGLLLFQLRANTISVLQTDLEAKAMMLMSLAETCLENAEDSLDGMGVSTRLERLVSFMPDVVFIAVRDADRNIVTFVSNPNATHEWTPLSTSTLLREASHDLLIYEKALLPESGFILLGVETDGIQGISNSVMAQFGYWLLLSILLGHVVMLIMVRTLTQPLRELLHVTGRLREGVHDVRAKVCFNDEIGQLAGAVNALADTLEERDKEVETKEKTRLSLMKRIVHSQETERKMLARNLHDEIGQSLSHLLIKVNGLCNHCANTSELSVGLTNLIDETRKLAWDFRPSILDDYGLDSALRRYAQEHFAPLDIEVKCESVNLDAARNCCCHIPNEVEVTLYRIAQEALTNIIRHASAKNVSIILIRKDCYVTLLIEDDGCGFDINTLDNGDINDLGIMGMKERAQLIGGNIIIETHPGEGAIVRITVSLKQAGI